MPRNKWTAEQHKKFAATIAAKRADKNFVLRDPGTGRAPRTMHVLENGKLVKYRFKTVRALVRVA